MKPIPPAPQQQKQFISPGKRHAESEVRIAGETMKRIEDGDIYRMPETVFVGVFLNFFHSGKIDKRYIPEHCEDGLDTWVSIIKNGYDEVHIVNPKGEVLFSVPPVMNRLAVTTQFNSKQGIARDIANAELYSAYGENHSIRHLEAALESRKMLKIDPGLLSKYGERWNSIYTRYGLEPIAFGTAKVAEATAAAAATTSEKIQTDYEDWEQA